MNWYLGVQRIFKRMGFEIRRSHSEADYTIAPCRNVTYAPWFGDDFQSIYARIRDHTWVSPDRCYLLHGIAQYCCHLGVGDLAECGVYRGGTALLIAEAMKTQRHTVKRLHLFDSFQGMPREASVEGGIHREGQFSDTSFERIKELLAAYPEVVYHAGWIPEVFSEVDETAVFAFVHLDCDLAETTRACLEFFIDRMVSGGALVIDDYGFPSYRHTLRAAVDHFFAGRPENALALPTGQCLVLKP